MAAERRHLTAAVHQALAPVLRPGDWALDATLGNGLDTEFLARRVGPTGRVFGLDRQPAALAASAARLLAAGLREVCLLLQCDHAELATELPAAARGRLRAAVFNLGYLPGGDKRIRTTTASSLQAAATCLDWLASPGWVSILAYTGHPGGEEEASALRGWAERLPRPGHRVRSLRPAGHRPPWWIWIEKR